MHHTHRRVVALALALALPLLLSACAVSQQGNRTSLRLDQDELTATTLQRFQLGTAEGVLRRTLASQYQIKLYDRMKLIDLGRVENPRIVDAQRLPGYDLVAVHVPTRSCPYAHRLYELVGHKVGMWEINNTPGRCNQPVSFASDGKVWLAQQEGGRSDSLIWFWSDGKLIRAVDPKLAGGSPLPVPAAQATAGPRRPVARFESDDSAPPAAPAKPRATAAVPAAPAPASAPKRIDAGRYSRLPSNGVTEVAPARVVLRDAD